MDTSFPFVRSEQFRAWVDECAAAAGATGGDAASPNPFALQPDTLSFLREVLRRTRPSRAVEFGGGRSTDVFAEWQRADTAFSFMTLEHDRTWARQLTAAHPVARVVHLPLRPLRAGARVFLTYKGLENLGHDLADADLFLIDGPHAAGREAVLFAVLGACKEGALILIDDLLLEFVQAMLASVPRPVGACFAGAAVAENSHGLFVLRCLRPAPPMLPPWLGVPASARSVWRCLRDAYLYGTGD